jgi:N6-adenosine-specific RNA methylase IME4
VNFLATRKREHSRKPDELYPAIESCSYGRYLELFATHSRPGWGCWGNEVNRSPVFGPSGRQPGPDVRLKL